MMRLSAVYLHVGSLPKWTQCQRNEGELCSLKCVK